VGCHSTRACMRQVALVRPAIEGSALPGNDVRCTGHQLCSPGHVTLGSGAGFRAWSVAGGQGHCTFCFCRPLQRAADDYLLLLQAASMSGWCCR